MEDIVLIGYDEQEGASTLDAPSKTREPYKMGDTLYTDLGI